MANPEHVEILKQGVGVWNQWRDKNPEIVPDLIDENMRAWGNAAPDFSGINLSRAKLGRANLTNAFITDADLRGAYLNAANLSYSFLNHSDLTGAHLLGTDLTGAILINTKFYDAIMGVTMLGSLMLSEAKGLATVHHRLPSTIGIDTLYLSGGDIPKTFLRGLGVPEDFITYMRSLVAHPIQFYSCFISYSSKDQDFANRLYADLQNRGVRCWFAPEDMKIGDRFRIKIDESIRVYDKLLLVLSENSVASSWVEKEVETAMEREAEDEKHRTILFPVRLDDAVMNIKTGWPADVRRTRHIGDFTRWKDHDSYQKSFDRLLRDLKAEEKQAAEG